MSYTTNNKFTRLKISYYIELIKPRIVIGNIISIIGGFFIASKEKINILLLLTTIIGTSLVIAGNCVLNNIIDRNLDSLMQRTKNRVLVLQLITLKNAFIYAIILLLIGFCTLFYATNVYIIHLSIISSIIYIGIYTILMKKTSIYSTLIGSISGSAPPAIGYCAITNTFDIGAVLLMILFILWQIAHAHSIAILRIKDYKQASIPIFPLKKGITVTKKHIIYCIILFMITLPALTYIHHIGYISLLLIEILTGTWLQIVCGTNTNIVNNNIVITQWSKKMFIMSIIVITFFNISICIDSLFYLKYHIKC